MQKFQLFVGVDVSKATLDSAVCDADGADLCPVTQCSNTAAGIRKWIRALRKLHAAQPAQILVCLEHTGWYSRVLIAELLAAGLTVWAESALQILRAGGIQRGKSDAVDAMRIMQYALRFQDRARPYSLTHCQTLRLQDLVALRRRLMRQYNALRKPIAELKPIDPTGARLQQQRCATLLRNYRTAILAVEGDIQQALTAEPQLHTQQQLLQSIPGVGPVLTWNLLAYTHGFTRLSNPRELACYAGVAPFDYQSGTSRRGRSRVSKTANLTLKTHLHMAVLALVRAKKLTPLKAYYQRKVEEGKNKMLVLNALRNKLIHIICAVIERQTPYVEKIIPNPLTCP